MESCRVRMANKGREVQSISFTTKLDARSDSSSEHESSREEMTNWSDTLHSASSWKCGKFLKERGTVRKSAMKGTAADTREFEEFFQSFM